MCVWGGVSVSAAGREDPSVVIVFGHQKTYHLAAQAMGRTLRTASIEPVLIELPKGGDKAQRARMADQLLAAHASVIAAAGVPAVLLALSTAPDVPVVCVMVPNVLDAPFAGPDHAARSRLAGIAADVAPAEWFEWIGQLHRAGSRVGLLHSTRTKRTAEAIATAGRKAGFTIKTIEADRDHFPEAISALNQNRCDSVLMIPDGKVYNAPNVKRLLLWGIRQKKPVWAFSASVVKAGALAGHFVDAESVGGEAANLVKEILDGADAASIGIRYPRQTQRAVNQRTAEAIGVPLPDRAGGAAVVHYGDRP